MNFNFKLTSVLTLILVLILGFNSCVHRLENATTIKIKGSDTMFKLLENLAAIYMENHKEVIIFVEGGGSNKGFEALNKGEADIAMSSRAINSNEIKQLAEKYSKVGVSNIVAKDVFGIYLNQLNSASDLSIKNIKDIFTCKVNNWNEISNFKGEIYRVIRSPNTGTFGYFQSFVLDEENYCENAITISNNKEIINTIESNKNAIGYGSLIHKGNIKIVSINGYLPNDENISNDKYPLIRYLELFTKDTPSPQITNFINWIQGKEGQKIVKNNGLIPTYKFSY
ncbi:MAG: phosphate ABC transporter substrate-binding protein [Candidatus Kapaibacteriota bacterium]|jgi:phosphate transport system substrate-binding protein